MPLDELAMAEALRAGHIATLGFVPGRARLMMALSHVRLGARAGVAPPEAIAYWRELSTRYAPALALFDTGDAGRVAEMLGRLGCATGPRCASSLAALYDEHVARLGNRYEETPMLVGRDSRRPP